MAREYRTIDEVAGPLMVVRDVEDVKYDELGEIELPNGELRRCKVLEIDGSNALVQLFESSMGINVEQSICPLLGRGMELAVSPGHPGTHSTVWEPDRRRRRDHSRSQARHQRPPEPAARDYPNEFIQTGVSAIDGLNTLVRGQKLPIFSAFGSAAALAAQIARQAKVLDDSEKFAVVFGAMGITFEEAKLFMENFRETGAISRAVMFINLADDPAIERISTPRMALTAAEYLAFEQNMHVLVILTDITY